MTPREWIFCSHPSFRVLVLGPPDENAPWAAGHPLVSWWSPAQNVNRVSKGYLTSLSGAEIQFYLLSQKPRWSQ